MKKMIKPRVGQLAAICSIPSASLYLIREIVDDYACICSVSRSSGVIRVAPVLLKDLHQPSDNQLKLFAKGL